MLQNGLDFIGEIYVILSQCDLSEQLPLVYLTDLNPSQPLFPSFSLSLPLSKYWQIFDDQTFPSADPQTCVTSLKIKSHIFSLSLGKQKFPNPNWHVGVFFQFSYDCRMKGFFMPASSFYFLSLAFYTSNFRLGTFQSKAEIIEESSFLNKTKAGNS